MHSDCIASVEIDNFGRLRVVPSTAAFPYIHRAGMEVTWDDATRSLHSPRPREWSHVGWYRQIVSAVAREYGCRLLLTERTVWINVDSDIRAQLLQADAVAPDD